MEGWSEGPQGVACMLITACGWGRYIFHASRDTAEGNGLSHLAGSPPPPQEGSLPGQGTSIRESTRKAAPPHGERTSTPLVSARYKARVPPLPVLTSTWGASLGVGGGYKHGEGTCQRKLSHPHPPALQEQENQRKADHLWPHSRPRGHRR